MGAASGGPRSDGAVNPMQLGNGLWESTQFNSRLQPVQIGLGTSVASQNLLKLNYDYGTNDNNGNVLSQRITVSTVGANNGFTAVQNYSYDSLNRLKSAVENVTPYGGSAVQSWKQTYSFDRYGNRRFDEPNTTTLPKNCGTPPNQTVCPADVPIVNPTISTANNRLSSTGWQYDAAGNTTADPEGRKFIYDAENKQTEVRDSQNTLIGQYRYDGDGRRVKKIVPSTAETTIFVYDASAKLVAEYSTIVESPSTAKVNYLTMDHLGSPRINTDANGNITARHDYMPFGEEIYTVQRTQSLGYTADTVRKQFTGYERDNESDLDFAEARYYNYNHGRFSSPDNFLNDTHKEDPASWNLYVYVRNNPLTYVDPTGEELRLIRITDKDGNVVENIDGENRKALLGWLNHTYGCSSCVTVDKNNVIQLDTSQVSKEVLAATKDLTDAINDKNHIAFVVGYDGHSKVNFAQAQQNALEVGGKKYDAILVDFKDFRGLSGDKAAVSSFTNYAFVHEVFHLFPSLLKDDISSEDVTGPVENKVNEIRQARGDLLRATYNARSDTEIWGEMDFGTAKVNKKTGQIMRNVNNGILVEKKKIVRWNIRMTGN